MKIRVELASGRAVEGTVCADDEGVLKSMTDEGPTGIPQQWIVLLNVAAADLVAVNLAHAETITELPE